MNTHAEMVERRAKELMFEEWPDSDWEFVERYNPTRTENYRARARAIIIEREETRRDSRQTDLLP